MFAYLVFYVSGDSSASKEYDSQLVHVPAEVTSWKDFIELHRALQKLPKLKYETFNITSFVRLPGDDKQALS